MSDTKNKTKKKAEVKAEAKTAETAPYLKKGKQQDNQAESSKTNVLIPLVLLLVSAIVIFATFYNDEDEGLVARDLPLERV